MAEIQQQTSRRKLAGVCKSKKHSTRVDLTPMVDLGFLLLTFFIFTTSMASPNALNITMPFDSNDSMEVGKSEVMHVLLAENHSMFYYSGNDLKAIQPTDDKLVRDIIIRKKRILGNDSSGKSKLVVLIKAAPGATYGDVINVINEMLINDVGRYMILDPSVFELDAISK